MSKNKKTISYALEKKAITFIGVLIIGLSIVYSYFIMLSVSHVVLREEITFQSERLSDEVSRLEQQYLSLSNQLTENKALSLGFRKTKEKTFVERGLYSLRDAR